MHNYNISYIHWTTLITATGKSLNRQDCGTNTGKRTPKESVFMDGSITGLSRIQHLNMVNFKTSANLTTHINCPIRFKVILSDNYGENNKLLRRF